MNFRRGIFLLSVLSATASLSIAPSAQRETEPKGPPATANVESLKFRYMGPAAAGRIATVAGVPGDPSTYYLGSASGGVWKSTDGGQTFVPIFDDQPVAAIGSDCGRRRPIPTSVWVGTGEPWVIRYSDVMGDGVYKSDRRRQDLEAHGTAGDRTHLACPDPSDQPRTSFTSARRDGSQVRRKSAASSRSTDGGATWKRVLFVDANTGCSGLAIDEKDPNTLLAGYWQVEQHTWVQRSGGPGSGVYITHDGGAKWTKLTSGHAEAPGRQNRRRRSRRRTRSGCMR